MFAIRFEFVFSLINNFTIVQSAVIYIVTVCLSLSITVYQSMCFESTKQMLFSWAKVYKRVQPFFHLGTKSIGHSSFPKALPLLGTVDNVSLRNLEADLSCHYPQGSSPENIWISHRWRS